ncbi:MerR family transcriptional regulator [Gordonia sp. ABKF26]|uniref:MerR family transcriptional regulator n=1 Tax=Gordonia sp. ABKF26 TaxID=3238687 RepID=UPI0034E5729F
MMTIGDFSRATRLSAKALRFYHRVGLLEPARIDAATQYRYYTPEQIDDARVIHHLRSLDMPVEEVRCALTAPSAAAKNEIIADHLRRMEQRLAETQSAVESLRRLLTDSAPTSAPIERRVVPAVSVLVIRDTIDLVDLGGWFTQANEDLDDELERSALSAQGPRGGLWSTELFLDERGDCAVFWPVSPTAAATGGGRVRREVLPPVHMAVATHHGDDATIGDVYADLGAYVSEHGIGAPGPVRETYVDGIPGQSGTTEIAWPVHS